MTNIFTVHLPSDHHSGVLQYAVDIHNLKRKILSRLFRMKSILKGGNSLEIKNSISQEVIRNITREEIIPENLINTLITQYLLHIRAFSRFMGSCIITRGYSPGAKFRKARVYLHKIHKIAPVFNYTRAKFNLRSIQTFFHRTTIWPRISTRLALTIYITDKKVFPNKPLQPSNIRALTHCSAYAFYHNKKVLIKKGVLIKHE